MRATRALILLAAVASVSPSRSLAAEIHLRARLDVDVGSSPSDFAFVGGKRPRLFVAGDAGIAVFRSDPYGWVPAGRVTSSPYVKSVAVADLDGDGTSDLAYVDRDEGRIHVVPGRDDGSYGKPIDVPIGFVARRVRVGALGPAGTPVLLVVHSGGLSVLRHAESGSFHATRIEGSGIVRDVGFADVNGDGTPDLILASDGADLLRLLEAGGAGQFRPGAELPTLGQPQQILALPRTGDKGGDLVVVTDRGLVLHRRTAAGFEPAQLIWDEPHLAAVAAGDVNGDGRPDLAVTSQSRGTLTFFRGHSGRSFRQEQSYTVGRAPTAVLLVDFDGDGAIDGLTLNELGDSVTVLHGRGKGRFESSPCILGEATDFDAIAAADFNRDDHLDLAVTSRTDGSVSLFFGDGFGHFAPRPPLRVGRQPRGIVAEDFDGDGSADLAVVNFGGDDVAVLIGDGRGGFHAPVLVSVGLGPVAIVAGAFGGDGHIDLAVANSLSRSVSILYGDRRGRFADVVNFAVESIPTFLLTADADGDGHTDLVVGSERGENVALLHGDGERLQPPEFNALGTIARPSIAEDFNRDGHLDLVLLQESDDAIEILPGRGGGEFDTGLRFPVGRNPTAALTGDFDGDGQIDLAVVHGAARTISILLNRSERQRPEQVARHP